jgi:hypothetical protein
MKCNYCKKCSPLYRTKAIGKINTVWACIVCLKKYHPERSIEVKEDTTLLQVMNDLEQVLK